MRHPLSSGRAETACRRKNVEGEVPPSAAYLVAGIRTTTSGPPSSTSLKTCQNRNRTDGTSPQKKPRDTHGDYIYIYICMYVCMYVYGSAPPIDPSSLASTTYSGRIPTASHEKSSLWVQGYIGSFRHTKGRAPLNVLAAPKFLGHLFFKRTWTSRVWRFKRSETHHISISPHIED